MDETMTAFYEAYAPDVASSAQAVPKSAGKKVAQAVRQLPSKKVAQPVRQTDRPSLPDVLAGIPWGHNIVLLQKLSDFDERLWYAAKAVENGWSRAVLTVQIETDLYGRMAGTATATRRLASAIKKAIFLSDIETNSGGIMRPSLPVTLG